MEGEIRIIRTEMFIHFKERGDSFSLDVPHYNVWISMISFLKKRGFVVGENKDFKRDYAILSKYHKIGFKKDIVVLINISGASIEVKFGSIKNLWNGSRNHFWNNPSDERYTKLSYLENTAIGLEVFKMTTFYNKRGLSINNTNIKLSPEQEIINDLRSNTHIHGIVNELNDIKLSITEDSYDYIHNSNDKNKKKIISGELKYFYSWETKRLSCGIAWHHINNMWWVIVNKKRHNMSSSQLFDFDSTLPKRQQPDKEKIQLLLNKYSSSKNFERCIGIRDFHLKTA